MLYNPQQTQSCHRVSHISWEYNPTLRVEGARQVQQFTIPPLYDINGLMIIDIIVSK